MQRLEGVWGVTQEVVHAPHYLSPLVLQRNRFQALPHSSCTTACSQARTTPGPEVREGASSCKLLPLREGCANAFLSTGVDRSQSALGHAGSNTRNAFDSIARRTVPVGDRCCARSQGTTDLGKRFTLANALSPLISGPSGDISLHYKNHYPETICASV